MGFLGRRWFQLFVSGLVLLYLVERVLVETGNLNFVPSGGPRAPRGGAGGRHRRAEARRSGT